ncbi:hypothetical protein N752_06070 [Desulforamulus aquiferis]|nr:hypothetical protein [Desulforamulus aquiferis]RYD06092.1 hypothetical protein N752_06070 [Desulforamulus aquiferis]
MNMSHDHKLIVTIIKRADPKKLLMLPKKLGQGAVPLLMVVGSVSMNKRKF